MLEMIGYFKRTRTKKSLKIATPSARAGHVFWDKLHEKIAPQSEPKRKDSENSIFQKLSAHLGEMRHKRLDLGQFGKADPALS